MNELKCDSCMVKKCDTRDSIKNHPEIRPVIAKCVAGCEEYRGKKE